MFDLRRRGVGGFAYGGVGGQNVAVFVVYALDGGASVCIGAADCERDGVGLGFASESGSGATRFQAAMARAPSGDFVTITLGEVAAMRWLPRWWRRAKP